MQKKRITFIAILFALLLVSLASAELTITEPTGTYNLGDRIYLTINGIKGADTGNLNVDMHCQNETINLLKISARAFPKDEETAYSLPYKELTKSDLEIREYKNILGECYITASINEDYTKTGTFTISNDIIIDAEINKTAYNPGEPITLKINAIKANGKPLNGFVEVSNATNFIKEVKEGIAQETFSTEAEKEAGVYKLHLHAYDQIDGGILNEKEKSISFIINQVPSFIQTSLSNPEISPEENQTIGIEIYDQSGKKLEGDAIVTLTNPIKEETKRIEIPSGEFETLTFNTSATAGTWLITARYEDVVEEKEFEMKELQKARFEFLENGLLSITNVGNTRYNRTIEIKIGEEIRELKLDIQIGEERKFDISAPEGEYDVAVSDEQEEVAQSMFLTGRAVSVDDADGSVIFSSTFLWIFIILLLAAAAVVFFLKYKKTHKASDRMKNIKQKMKSKVPKHAHDTINFTTKSPDSQSLDESNFSKPDDSLKDLTHKKLPTAESSLVMDGQKTKSTIISLAIKNYSELNENSKQTLEKTLEDIKEHRGLVEFKGETITIIYSPIITKTFKNEALALKATNKIEEILKNHNKKFTNKIKYGIGINTGDLIASKKQDKLKYTSTGNAVSLARRLSKTAQESTYITESVRNKLMRSVKVDKAQEISGMKVYKVQELRDKEEDQEKLKIILDRMKKEERHDKDVKNSK